MTGKENWVSKIIIMERQITDNLACQVAIAT